MSHGDSVTKVPPQFKVIASSADCAIAGIADEKNMFMGFSFIQRQVILHKGKNLREVL